MGFAESVQLTTLPAFSRLISPALSRMRRCFMKPVRDIGKGCDKSVTGRLPPARSFTTSRRVGSASAPNTASRERSLY